MKINKPQNYFLIFISTWLIGQNNGFIVKVNSVIGKNTEFWKAAGSDHLFYHSLKPAGQFLLKRMGQKNSHHYKTFLHCKEQGR